MFTGIVDHWGTIQRIETQAAGLRLWIETQFTELAEGESIAVDGACLTVTRQNGQQFSCDISPETCRLTLAGNYQVGQKVNLERSLRVGDRLGGHFVSGHVDQKGRVSAKNQVGDYIQLQVIEVNQKFLPLLVSKGSITVNGVSLTINAVLKNGFEVMLIPQTLKLTNLQDLRVGSPVNLEFDMLAKLVENMAKPVLERMAEK